MATFVLVHGAWHGGWCWQRVTRQLTDKGHRVFAPSLTGLGDRAHLLGPDVNLSTHVQDIAGIFDSYDLDDVVLCGHSYGGLVITAIADRMPGNVHSLVYLDALVPEDGQSMFDTIPQEAVDEFEASTARGDGFSVPPMSGEQFGVNDQDVGWMNEKCCNHPIGCFSEHLALSGAHKRVRRRTYILACGFDHPSTKAHYAAFEDDPDWGAVVMQGGHDLMIDNPTAVAEVLLGQL
jgi:pimeloyl-ACP methyl ester carboxylesterase